MYLKRLVIIALLLLTASAFADIKQAQIFTDSMVIQRETKAPIWGWAEPGEQVEVSGSWGKTASAVTDKDGKWQVCSPETAGGFSGLAYYTARDLHKELKVPIGLIIAASGGTFIQSYISAEYLKDDHWAKIQEKQAAVYTEEKANADYKQKLEVWAEEAKKTKAENKKVPSKPRLERDPRKDKNYPGSLYRGTIAPIEPFGLKGAIWYQGENEATTPIHAFGPNRAERYRVNLRNLINCWRKQWANPELPFYFVQLPNFKEPKEDPNAFAGGWPIIRESCLDVAKNMPDTGMAVAIDIGEVKSIHPKNKHDLGKRMASVILNKTYRKNTPTSPLYTRSEIEGNKVVIHFDYTGSGLLAKGGKLESFAIAGKNKKFVWADAVIEKRDGKDVVIVSSPQVEEPASVRYAWAMNPDKCNLYTNEGFPASPFRTDNWDLYKKNQQQ